MQAVGEKVDIQKMGHDLTEAQREMIRMGMIDEMISESLDDMDVEEEAEEMVERLIEDKRKDIVVKRQEQKEAKEERLKELDSF